MIETLAGYVNILLSYFYIVAGSNYGIAIIMLSAVVNIITFPLTRKQIQSSKKLQDIQPELKKLQEKYKHDKEKYNKVTMEYMKENKVNPLGGCLPLIVQFPIIIAVFHLLRDPSLIAQRVEMLGYEFSSSFLFGLDLVEPDPIYLLPIMAAAATFFHQRMVLTDPKQKMMLYIFPVMIMVISVSFPSGLVLYWLTNSIFSIGNHFLMKSSDGKLKEIKDNVKNGHQENNGKADVEDSKVRENADEEKAINSKRKIKKDIATPKKIKAADGPKIKRKSTKGKKKGAGKDR
ncbi:MAG: YidC/Oxa1 family membrane protein insertase [Bacillota bacterium]|nr:YidC/Oxa1 family membrane protein insertase [Bacillota bacterium]